MVSAAVFTRLTPVSEAASSSGVDAAGRPAARYSRSFNGLEWGTCWAVLKGAHAADQWAAAEPSAQ